MAADGRFLPVAELRARFAAVGVTGAAECAHLVELARLSRRRGMPFAQYRDVFAPEIIRFFGYESTASWIGELELLVVPGLLQLPEYTSALIRDGHGVSGPVLERIVESRRERQQILHRDDPPDLSFVLDEAVLIRAIGGSDVMTRQLAHLSDVARRPHVTIRILPLSLGAHAGLRGSFTYLKFADENDPDVVFMENRRGDSIFENDDDVTSTTFTLYRDLEEHASRPEDLDRYVERALDTARS